MNEWHIQTDSGIQGPFSPEEMKEKVRRGEIPPETLISKGAIQAGEIADWHINNVGSESGPFSTIELIQKARSGQISPNTLLRKGKNGWTRVSKFRFLSDLMPEKVEPDIRMQSQERRPQPPAEPAILSGRVVTYVVLFLFALSIALQTSVPLTIALLIFILWLYFLPANVAKKRSHPQATAIFALNLLLGWTFLGWALALVWALTATPKENT